MPAGGVRPQTLGELWDSTPDERRLAEDVALLEAQIKSEARDTELREEQLSWAQDTLRALVDLVDQAASMRVADLRRELREIVAGNRAEF